MDIEQDIAEPKAQLETTPSPSPGAAFSSSTQGLQLPQGLSHPYPQVSAPGRIFSLDFLIPKLRTAPKAGCKHRAQPLHALLTHSLHRSYSRDTNPSPKTCKGHEGEAGGLEKKEQHLELLSGTAEITFI